MRVILCILGIVFMDSIARAGSIIEQVNALGYGTLSGRLQTLSMYRDYEYGNNNYATTLGLKLDYLSPEKKGWTAGASYIGVGVADSMDYGTSSHPGEDLLLNGRLNVLNEAWLKYDMTELGLTNSTASVGRLVNNGEVFRQDEFRQKPRALEAVVAETRAFHKTRLLIGHAWRESNMWDTDSHPTISSWKFENFGDVFNAGYDTDGVTWGELENNCIDQLDVAVFDAIAYDVVNLIGARARYAISDETALLAYVRAEHDIGRADGHDATAGGLSLEQKIDAITLEGGYFGVGGDTLAFQELTTGINHALGTSLMLYSGQFLGGANTLYAKASTKIEKSKTSLSALYNCTVHDESKTDLRMAQELNVVIKQPIPKVDNLTVALKCGVGTRDGVNGVPDTTGTDTRLFVTYLF